MKKSAVCLALMFLWLAWHLAVPIDLTGTDLGRHLKNGELILKGTTEVLHKNFYSYTYPQNPFINHHWLFGVFTYDIWRMVDFTGLALVFIGIQCLVFYLFFRQALFVSSFSLAAAFGLLSFPLVSLRYEIRPEIFSMLFCGLFWGMLHAFKKGKITSSSLITGLVIFQILWVNTHLFFVFGPILTALYFVQALLKGLKQEAKVFALAFVLLLLSCLCNPSGWQGAVYPLEIFKGFGYPIMEEQSLFFIYAVHYPNPAYHYFLVTLFLLWLPLLLIMKRDGLKKHVLIIILALVMSLGAVKAVRMMGAYGLFFIPMAAYGWHHLIQSWNDSIQRWVAAGLVVSGIMISSTVNFDVKRDPSFGLKPHANEAAKFYKEQGLKGPIFNNFDIGGYLIFHLAPEHKFFVDNRPEAFPAEFFHKVYIPMQVNDTVWNLTDDHYRFNTIFFNRRDLTPWGHRFLMKRLQDPLWAVVFVDSDIVIFLKRNEQNRPLIAQYEWQVVKLNRGGVEDFKLVSPQMARGTLDR